ncbi:hypothetical protein [Agarivorans sp. QJM3NY_25]|uniref:hypothetical protein n=1 Tax=Agarivorans sp. QJM3NY_25 TaxID=3421430 RepID=UPI003D7D3606
MGSKSSSSQASNSTNTSLSQAIQGNNEGVVLSGDGNVLEMTTTDMGAMNAAKEITEQGVSMVGDLASSVTENNRLALQESGDLARDMLSTTVGAVDAAMSDNTSLANNAINQAGSVFGSAGNLLSDMGQVISNAALDNHLLASTSINAQSDLATKALTENSDLAFSAMDLSRQNLTEGSNLVYELAKMNDTTQSDNQKYFYDSLANASKQAYQFADNASRSDGQQLAIESNKTIQYTVLAVVVGAVLIALKKAKK